MEIFHPISSFRYFIRMKTWFNIFTSFLFPSVDKFIITEIGLKMTLMMDSYVLAVYVPLLELHFHP